MATYTAIPDANLQPDKPARSIDGLALRDNPIAIAEGASGAPRIEDAALDTGAATTAGKDWVNKRTALSSVGEVGTYAFLIPKDNATATYNPGDTAAGADLAYTGEYHRDDGAYNKHPNSATVIAGTWRCMGYSVNQTNEKFGATLWLRIS